MIYAPVAIPTLNRFNHFKQCIESLNRCHNADKTEVFVSVDYPPSDKYRDGYNKICEYLDNTSFVFKQLHVFKQTENLGVRKGGSKNPTNAGFLSSVIIKDFDRLISTEDDNIFAPGFLDFMNLCLERFKDDPTVYSVCGYNFYYNLKYGENNYYRQHADYNAWGQGRWRDKTKMISKLNVSYLRCILYNPFRVMKLWRVSNSQVAHLAHFSQKRFFKKADNFLTMYMIDKGMTQIMPAKSLVRNIGWDGSGLNCVGFEKEVIERHLNQEIDESPTFPDLKGTGWEFFKENNRIIANEDFQKVPFFKTFVKFIIRLLCYWK